MLNSALSTKFSSALPMNYQPSETCHSLASRSITELLYGMMLPDFGDSKGLTLSEGLWCLDGVPCHTHSHTLRLQWLKIGISRIHFSWAPSSAPHFQGTSAFQWGKALHITGIFLFSCFTCRKELEWVKTHSVTRLLHILICYLAIRNSLKYHWVSPSSYFVIVLSGLRVVSSQTL